MSAPKQPKRAPSKSERWRTQLATDPVRTVDERLEELQTEYSSGNKGALPIAIRLCAQTHRPLPRWAGDAWMAACNDVYVCNVRSWDDVLGHDPPVTEKQFARRRNEALLGERLLQLLPFLRDEPVDERFFAHIATHLEISERRAKTLYYEMPERFRLPQKKARKAPPKRNVPQK